MKHFVTSLVLALCVTLAAASASVAGEVSLSVAASLKDVVTELSERFARKNPGVKFVKNFGASGVLAKQIENGAPADIFIPASVEWMDYLKARKLVDPSSIGTLAFNTLVFAGNPAGKARAMQDLPGLGRIAIGSPKSVPAGAYAMEALKKAGVDQQLAKKLVMARDVRDALMYAERGEADGAFVYRTDALRGKRAKILFTVPPELYPRISYPMALTAAGVRNEDAADFHRFLRSAEARAVLEKYGFAVR